jgi:GTP-binding protein HflX
MTKPNTLATTPPRQKAFLVGVDILSQPGLVPIEDSLEELAMLADTAGIEVVGELFQRLDKPHPATFIGTGKIEEVILLIEELKADVLIFDEELSPRHLREIEKRINEKIGEDRITVLDRTALILDIFALHANTSEGKLQVELAQYQYRLPRLTRAWTHLARQSGGSGGRSGAGGVGLRGPGETQLEMDRREILQRISFLKKELEKVRAHRSRHRKKRQMNQIPSIALVGYTNAGKSTLLNQLANANVFAANQLFATLDPTTRKVILPAGTEVLVSDTVGFIQKLPTQLIAAFRATLEEINEADLLLHIIDMSHPNADAQYEAVCETLEEIDASEVPTINVLNKIDRLPDMDLPAFTPGDIENPVYISALKNQGIDELFARIEEKLLADYVEICTFLPYNQGKLISLFHQYGSVDSITHQEDGVEIKGLIPQHLLSTYKPFATKIQRVNR